MNDEQKWEYACSLAHPMASPIRNYILSLADEDAFSVAGMPALNAGEMKKLIRKAMRQRRTKQKGEAAGTGSARNHKEQSS